MQQEGDSGTRGSVRPVALMRRYSHSRPPVSAHDFISCFTGKVEAIEGERRPPAGPQPVLCLLLTPCRGPHLLPGELFPLGLEHMPLVFSGCCYCRPSLCFSPWLPYIPLLVSSACASHLSLVPKCSHLSLGNTFHSVFWRHLCTNELAAELIERTFSCLLA